MNKLKDFFCIFTVLVVVLGIAIGMAVHTNGSGDLSLKDILLYLFGAAVGAGVLVSCRSESNNMG